MRFLTLIMKRADGNNINVDDNDNNNQLIPNSK